MNVCKMQTNGYDFCVVEYEENIDYEILSQKICNRNLAIGALGLIVVKNEPLEMLYYSNKGVKIAFNSNALLAFIDYVFKNKILRSKVCKIIVGSAMVEAEIIETQPKLIAKICLNRPIFNNQIIRVSDLLDSFGRVLKIDDKNITVYSFYLCDIETVVFVDSLDDEIINYAEKICNHNIYLKKTNVTFAHIIDKKNIETKSFDCSINDFVLSNVTGDAAACQAAYKLGLAKNIVKCKNEIGYVDCEINKKELVFVSGSSSKVFSCDYNMEVEIC